MDIELVKVFANSDPITGQNVEAVIRLTANDQRNIKTVKEITTLCIYSILIIDICIHN